MEQILLNLNFAREEVEQIKLELINTSVAKVERVVNLLLIKGCAKAFVREIILNRQDIFSMDLDKLEYTIEGILANNDNIEEILLDIV